MEIAADGGEEGAPTVAVVDVGEGGVEGGGDGGVDQEAGKG